MATTSSTSPVRAKPMPSIGRMCTLKGHLSVAHFKIFVKRSITRKKPIEAPSGRTTISAVIPLASDEITFTITKPTTSSSIAAAITTVLIRVVDNCVAESIAKVVPKDVDEEAAPAAKALSRVISSGRNKGIRRNDRAIGSNMPVIATRADGIIRVLSRLRSVFRPPSSFDLAD
jgi:hypothetical protein